VNVGFEPDLEEQQNDADLGKQPYRLTRRDPPQQARAEHDPGEQFANNRGHPHAGGNFRAEAGREQDRDQVQEDRVDRHRCDPLCQGNLKGTEPLVRASFIAHLQ